MSTADQGNQFWPFSVLLACVSVRSASYLCCSYGYRAHDSAHREEGDDSPDHIGMAERLAGLVADGRTTVIEGTEHYPNVEHPEAFQRAVTEFL